MMRDDRVALFLKEHAVTSPCPSEVATFREASYNFASPKIQRTITVKGACGLCVIVSEAEFVAFGIAFVLRSVIIVPDVQVRSVTVLCNGIAARKPRLRKVLFHTSNGRMRLIFLPSSCSSTHLTYSTYK